MQEFFAYIKTIHPITKEAEEALAGISREVAFKKNTDVQPIGHTCRTIYFVKKGALRIYYFKDGIDITESFEFENAIVARAESLFSGRPSKKAIQAIEEAVLIAINSPALFSMYDAYPELERLFRKIFEEAYVKTVNRLESLQFHTAEERYVNLLKDYPDVLKRVPLKFIASYLGITQVSLSRIRAKK
jgi:CRP-like cAMP-binding protein